MTTYIIGDIHGHLDRLIELLSDAGLLDERHRWVGVGIQLWLIGDYFDRGPHGVGVVDLIMRLQAEASDTGSAVHALLGNHEVLFLGAHRFRENRRFMLAWQRNGGQDADMALVTQQQLAWLRRLPAMAHVHDRLLMHADAMFYLHYGSTVEAVNTAIAEILRGDDTDDWRQLLDDFAERMSFTYPEKGVTNAIECLTTYGGKQIVHGHTPIQYVADAIVPQTPLLYADDLCINVDGGMYLGAPGFIGLLPE
ncbi:MAG: serine/threonine protein phosphatase [Anaerolineae bacterium]|nr:serine/threonine protein phosphatase [Anaerolineae bacterium]